MKHIRSIALPIITGSFLLVAITGIILFFNVDIGISREVHIFLAWTTVTGFVLYIISYFSLLKKLVRLHMREVHALVYVSVFALLISSSVFINVVNGGGNNFNSSIFLKKFREATISEIAPILDKTPEQLSIELQRKGYILADPNLTVTQIATTDNKADELIYSAFTDSIDNKD